MGKSSHKNKRSKHSSQSRKKSRKPKSKKLRRRPSVSLSEESESSSYESDSSLSSGEDYRRRRKNRGLRSKKRARGRSPSSGSSESEDEVRVKRKRSKRKGGYSGRRKSYKKKSRRSPSVSLMKCSSCFESSSSDESDFERSRGRKDKGKRELEKSRSRNRRGRDRSRSVFSRSLSRESTGRRSEERLMAENCSRRLRSVIIIAEGGENVELGKEGVKEEIEYDHSDYPSCRSNDSIDGVNKKEYAIDLQSHMRQVENDDITSSRFGGVDDFACQDNDYGEGKSGPLEGDKDSTYADTDRQNVYDLETILRQRALKNLLKFRGGLKNNDKKSNEKNERNDDNIQHSSSKGADFIKVESPKEVSARVVGSEVKDTIPVLERDDVVPSPNDEKYKIETDSGKNIDSGMQDPSCTVDQGTSKSKEKFNIVASSATCEPKSATVSQNGITRKSRISSEEAPASQKVCREDIVTESVRNIAAKNATGSTINDEVRNASQPVDPGSSHIEPPSEPHPNELQDQAKEGSQYEQKTMSVMRGGEMVQVSYKVYIPKKAPALTRRKLKR